MILVYRIAVMLAFAYGVASCNSNPPVSKHSALPPNTNPTVAYQTPAADTVSAQNNQQVAFQDLDNFDQELSQSLSKGSGLTEVSFTAPATINQIPPRIGKWIAAVKEKNGQITTDPPANKTRSILISALFALPAVYSYVKEHMLYNPAKDYDLNIAYNPDDGRIQKVTFIKKKVSSGK